jgi:ATP synthase F1 complex assembly factor 1
MMSMSMRMLRVGGPRWCSGALSLARAASTGTGGGFSYPGPRALGQIVKLELMQSEEREQIQHIWEQFHADKDDAVAATLSSDVFQTLQARATAAPFFVFPVYRQDGFFNMLCQFQQTCFLVTYLEAFKENPTGAPPCLAVSLYDELLENKEVGLVRGDVINMLDKRVRRVLLARLARRRAWCSPRSIVPVLYGEDRSHRRCSTSSWLATRTSACTSTWTSSTTNPSSSTLRATARYCRTSSRRRRRRRPQRRRRRCSWCNYSMEVHGSASAVGTFGHP